MSEVKNMEYYDLLGVSEKFTEAELKKAFRICCKIHHPDNNKGKEKEAGDIFAQVKEAYDTLKDPEKRKEYDRKGKVKKEGNIEERLVKFYNNEILPQLLANHSLYELELYGIKDLMTDKIKNKVLFHDNELETELAKLSKIDRILDRLSSSVTNDTILKSWEVNREKIRDNVESIKKDLEFLIIARKRLDIFSEKN
jgi:curved DNA-binding protein CbpA